MKTEGSRRRRAAATSETCVTAPERPSSSTLVASNPGRTVRGVSGQQGPGHDREPAHVGQRKAGQPGVAGRVDAEPIRGGQGRGQEGVMGQDDPLGLAR